MKRILAACAALVSLGAYAQQPSGPYLGAALGSADISIDVDEDATYKTDKFTWGVNLGWQITPYFGVEASYLKPSTIKEVIGSDSVSGKLSGITASLIGTLPLNERWSVHARLGGIVAKEKYSATISGLSYSYSDDTAELLYGVGAGVIVEGAKLRLDYQRAEFDYGKVGLLSLGINWFLFSGG